MLKPYFLWMHKHERSLSAVAMIAGFISDSLLFVRVDLVQTQVLFAVYTAACFIAIPLFHWFEMRVERGVSAPNWRFVLPFVTQFALGGFWSGFVIFYGRSADLGASWPFLIFLFGILVVNEYFHKYHDRLVFTSILFFFALYSYAIFEVPLYTGTIDTQTFLESGVAAIVAFALFTGLLRTVARKRFLSDLWRIRLGAIGVLVIINFFYFTNILPPLPLSAEAVGVYHSVMHETGTYTATTESGESWWIRYLGFSPTLHVISGESLSAYSSVFAPTILATSIVHSWQWYDPFSKQWQTKASIAYPIQGGRDGGYRGYSTVRIDQAGQWRISIETTDGRRIARLPFTAERVSVSPDETTITLP